MTALQILIIALLRGDGFLESLFTGVGATGTEVIADGGDRTTAQYPRLVLSVWGGKQHEYSDEEPELYVEDGRVQIEIVCQKSATCPEPLKTATSIQAHVQDILLGRKPKGLVGVKDREFSDGSGAFTCTRFVQTTPTGKLPSGVGYERRQITFDVTVQRLEE